MSARDELAGLVYLSGYEDVTSPRIQPLVERSQWEIDSHYAAADAILAAGYSKPRTITTIEELDALPDGSAYLMADGSIGRPRKWSAISHSVFYTDGSVGALHPSRVPLPATVLYTPKES